MPLDDVSKGRLLAVHPLLAEKIYKMAEMMEPERLRVTQGVRSWQEQEKLYAQGRTLPGNVVTKAAPGHSWHQFGLAVDLVPVDSAGSPDWNVQHPVWQRLVYIGETLGLVSGALFHSFPDWPHFQLTGTLPVSPNDEVRQIFKDGGIVSVWRAAFPDYPV
jgi:peptidoglycan L-alanyl-D-glutamate endopeptidase CwlK